MLFDRYVKMGNLLPLMFATTILILPSQAIAEIDVQKAMQRSWISCSLVSDGQVLDTQIVYHLAAVRADGSTIYRNLSVAAGEIEVDSSGTIVRGPVSCRGKKVHNVEKN